MVKKEKIIKDLQKLKDAEDAVIEIFKNYKKSKSNNLLGFLAKYNIENEIKIEDIVFNPVLELLLDEVWIKDKETAINLLLSNDFQSSNSSNKKYIKEIKEASRTEVLEFIYSEILVEFYFNFKINKTIVTIIYIRSLIVGYFLENMIEENQDIDTNVISIYTGKKISNEDIEILKLASSKFENDMFDNGFNIEVGPFKQFISFAEIKAMIRNLEILKRDL